MCSCLFFENKIETKSHFPDDLKLSGDEKELMKPICHFAKTGPGYLYHKREYQHTSHEIYLSSLHFSVTEPYSKEPLT